MVWRLNLSFLLKLLLVDPVGLEYHHQQHVYTGRDYDGEVGLFEGYFDRVFVNAKRYERPKHG